MRPRRVFLDANIFVAAAGRPEGGSAAVLDLCRRDVLAPLISRRVLLEADWNIRKKLPPEALRRYAETLTSGRFHVVPEPPERTVRRFLRVINEKDAPVLAAAVSSKAKFLITLDRDFHTPAVQRAARGCEIVEPGALLQRLRKKENP